MEEPILSLLFPLYRSGPFFNNLVRQIEQLSDPCYEIIISDRHCYDNTIDLLESRFKNDTRFRFIRATDHLNWVSHYNFLLQQARGKYFCWLPHDDTYSSDYFPVLISKIQEQDTAIAAFATMNVIGKKWEIDYSKFKIKYSYPLRSNQYMKLWNSGLLGIPFRGIFKTHVIIKKKLWINENVKLKGYQDLFWVFAVILQGGLIYTEHTSSAKNFAKISAHSHWKISSISKKNIYVLRLLYGYIYKSPLPFFTKLKMSINIFIPYFIRKGLNKFGLNF